MAGDPRGRRGRRIGSSVADTHAANSSTGKALCHPAASTHQRNVDAGHPGGRTSQENGGSMELKSGYRQTEVGIIPEDWEILQLEETARVVDSLHQTPSFSDDGYPMVRVTDIKTGNLSLNGTLKVSETVFAKFTKNYKPKRGDIVLSRVGSYG